MYVKLRDEFMVNGPIHLKQLGYLLNAVGVCNVNHFCKLSNDGASVLCDPRLSFYFDFGNNKYRVSLVRNITNSPGVVTFKMFLTHDKMDHSPMVCDISTPDEEIYAITFWNIFQIDNIKITSVVALTDVDEELEELIREYDKDLRAIEPGLKEHLEKLINEMEVNFIDDLEKDKIYALVSFNETKALSTNISNLEILRDAYCVRDQVTPEDFEIIEYDDFSDTSYIKALPKPLWSTELKKPNIFPSAGRMFAPLSNEEYALTGMRKVSLDCELALIKQYDSSDPLTGLMTYHGIVAGSGGCDDSFVHNNNFYCRADNKFEATSKYMEFIKGKANEQTSEKEN